MPRRRRGAAAHGAAQWWLLSATQTVLGTEITGQDSSFQLLRREFTKHLNLALKAGCITELEHHL